MPIQKLDIEIGAQDKTRAALASAEKNVKSFGDKLKASFGEESGLGRTMKALAGAGALAGLSVLARSLNTVAEKGTELAIALDKGDGSASEMAANLLKSIPIVGQLGEGLDRVRSLLDGSAVATARIMREAENVNMMGDAFGNIRKALEGSNNQAQKFHERIARTMALLNASPAQSKFLGIEFNRQDEAAGIRERADKQAADLKTANAARVAELRKRMNAIRIPMAIGDGSGEYGGTGEVVNQKDIDAAKRQREEIQRIITTIEKRTVEAVAKINDDAQSQAMALEKLTWAQRLKIVKEGGQSVVDTIREVWGKAMEQQREKIQDAIDQRRQDATPGPMMPDSSPIPDAFQPALPELVEGRLISGVAQKYRDNFRAGRVGGGMIQTTPNEAEESTAKTNAEAVQKLAEIVKLLNGQPIRVFTKV